MALHSLAATWGTPNLDLLASLSKIKGFLNKMAFLSIIKGFMNKMASLSIIKGFMNKMGLFRSGPSDSS